MTDSQIDANDLGNDVIATVNALLSQVSNADEGSQIMGMIEMLKPQVRQKVVASPEKAIRGIAVIHQSTQDVLEKHASDEDWEALAREGLEE